MKKCPKCEKKKAFKKEAHVFAQGLPKTSRNCGEDRRLDEKGLAMILKRINFLAQTKVYLFWKSS